MFASHSHCTVSRPRKHVVCVVHQLTPFAPASLAQAIDTLMKKNNVTNPRARKLTKRLSALDMTRGEYNLVKQTKGVAILRDGNPVDRDQALVNVMKKRDGRIR